jgi:hypothetical protein
MDLTSSSANVSLSYQRNLVNRNATNSQVTCTTGQAGLGGFSSGIDTVTAIDTTAATYFNMTVQNASAADASGVDMALLEWLEP